MNTENNDKKRNGRTEQRKSKRPRRRLVDLTLKPGTDRREVKEDRRKENTDLVTGRSKSSDTETR